MTDLAPNHPAVEAASRNAYERAWGNEREPWAEVDDLERDEWRADQAHSLSAALPHLTADDLRNTPAGRKLMAEGWEKGAETAWGRTGEGFNGECAFDHLADRLDQPSTTFRHYNPDTPNPYLEGDA